MYSLVCQRNTAHVAQASAEDCFAALHICIARAAHGSHKMEVVCARVLPRRRDGATVNGDSHWGTSPSADSSCLSSSKFCLPLCAHGVCRGGGVLSP